MKRFQFSLETALQWRDTQLRTEEAKLEQQFQRLHALENIISQCDTARAEEEAAVLRAPLINPQELVALDRYRSHLAAQKVRLQQGIRDIQTAIAAQQQRMVEVRRGVKLLEKLRQRQRDQWQADFDRELENEAADLYLAKWSAGDDSDT